MSDLIYSALFQNIIDDGVFSFANYQWKKKKFGGKNAQKIAEEEAAY